MILRMSRRPDATLLRAGLASAALVIVMAQPASAQQGQQPTRSAQAAQPIRTAQAAQPQQGQRPARTAPAAQQAQPQRPAAGQARPAAGSSASPPRTAQPTPSQTQQTRPAGQTAPAQGNRPAAGQTTPAQGARPATPAAGTAARPAAPASGPGGGAASLIAEFGSWAVYAAQAGRSKICYALAQPADRLPKNLNRDPAYLFVSFRPAENVRNEIALVMGFAAKEDAPAEAAIGTAAFALLPKGASAWLRNPAEEGQAIATMKRGQSLTVKVQSQRGNSLTDRYSLSGFAQAVERAQQECP